MNKENNKSYRSKLVKIIVESFIEEHLFDQTCDVKQELQNMLDSNLKFETKVSDFETKDEYNFGAITFKDENGKKRLVHVTITSNNITIKSYENHI